MVSMTSRDRYVPRRSVFAIRQIAFAGIRGGRVRESIAVLPFDHNRAGTSVPRDGVDGSFQPILVAPRERCSGCGDRRLCMICITPARARLWRRAWFEATFLAREGPAPRLVSRRSKTPPSGLIGGTG